MTDLLERADALAVLSAAVASAGARPGTTAGGPAGAPSGAAAAGTAPGGRVVLVRGEAGVGKSSLVRALAETHGDRARVLVGALYAVAPGVSGGLVIKGFAVLILGGLGSIPGAIIGGIVLGVTESFSSAFVSSGYKDVISFLLMIGVLLVRPEGLMRRRTR